MQNWDFAKEVAFRKWITNLPWYREFYSRFGEYPNLDAKEYDYRKAFVNGISPERDKYDQNSFHWPSSTSQGESLKSSDHPTYWKEIFMQKLGVNPDSVGVDEQGADRYMMTRQPDLRSQLEQLFRGF